jgi:cellulose biosynthesis protein BcsQ
MLSYTTYTEAGGVGKTTLAANLAVAHARAGLDVLCVPLDPQDGDLSHLLGVDDERSNMEVETLVHHLADRNQGELSELIRTTESGIDIIPEHNRLEDLGDALRTEKKAHDDFDEEYSPYTQLQRVLRAAGVYDQYDVLIADPPASSGPHLYNALDATRSLVLPFEPSGKGEASVKGLETLVDGLEQKLSIGIGVLAVVPNQVKGTKDQKGAIEAIRERGFDMPIVIGDRTSLLEGCWDRQCSAFKYVVTYRDRWRDYELETLAQFDRLARHIEQAAGVRPPNPPTPGDLDEYAERTAAEVEAEAESEVSV